VRTVLGRHAATIGVVVTSLRTGQAFSFNADRRFTSASLYKLFVLEAAEAAIEDGRLDPTETLTVTSAMVAADPYADLQAGTRTSVNCALETMVEMSGNSAADLLLRRVGASTVSARMQSLGFHSSAIGSEGAFTSPGDVAHLLGAIARGEAVNPAASQRMLDLLGAQQHNDRLPAPLPLNVRVAHKTGELPGLRHDAGIVFAPSGPYVVAVMVEDAPGESEARAAIVDISESVYAALEPGRPPRYAGLAPRLAQAVFRVADPQGRLALLGDPRTETAAVPAEVATSADADQPVRLRPEVVSDLVTLQQAAIVAGSPIWVRSGFRQPTDAEAAKAAPTEWILPCPVEQPQRVADRPLSAAEAAAAEPRQAWLGTTVAISDNSAGAPSTPDDRPSAAWQWLEAHATEYGFVPALPESADAVSMGHEPWTLRWVGPEMAARLRPVDGGDYAARAAAELERAEAELAAQDPFSARARAFGSDGCWTIATTSTRGCPSRWYFLGLPLS
jgi:beta-lactamase class A